MTDDQETIISALEYIRPSLLKYEEWRNVGMALKAEGLPCSVWDDWSRADSRYIHGECEEKWNTFNKSGITGGTIIDMAKKNGWKYSESLDWDSPLEYCEEVIASHSSVENEPWQMVVKYIKTLFFEDEYVNFVVQSKYIEERNKWIPANAGVALKRSRIITELERTHSLEDVFGTLNVNSGAWIRINPTDGKGGANKNVTRYDYALVESDSLPIEEQKKILLALNLPIAALVESGGKSVHAIVKVQANDEEEYSQRVSFLYNELAKHNFLVDTQNKNCSRLSRLPGVKRGDKFQSLIATNLGVRTWNEWIEYINGVKRRLPPFETYEEMCENPPEVPEEIIGGILRVGNKMIITGDSKSGKTCITQELAVDIVEGKPWVGKFKCTPGKVLYLNFEVKRYAFKYRIDEIYKSIGGGKNRDNLVIWNLRGYACPLDELTEEIINKCKDEHFSAIIFDPIYKIQGGDENNASDISKFCNELDRIANETGAAVIYSHHHAKGGQGEKKAIDRGSGSGVFARDPDAIVDLSFLVTDKGTLTIAGNAVPMRMEFSLREFESPKPVNLWFKFPMHFVDEAGMLENAAVEGSRAAGRLSSPKSSTHESRMLQLDEAFAACSNEYGYAELGAIAAYVGNVERCIRDWVKNEFKDKYYVKNNLVFAKEENRK